MMRVLDRAALPAVVAVLVALTASALPGTARAQEIGEVARLQGAASALGADGLRPLSAGDPVERGDVLRTGDGARLSLAFADGSTLDLGPGAEVALDGYVFEPDRGAFDQSLRILGGAFRFAGGALADRDPNAVFVKTPVATVGVRGTAFLGGAINAGMPPGQLHWGFMVTEGAIRVDTPAGGAVLDEPLEGTFLPMTGDAVPTDPRIWSEEAQTEIRALVTFR